MENPTTEKSFGIIRKFLTISLSTAINIVLSFLTTPIITRIVDPVDSGKLTMFNTYSTIIASFLYLGLNEALLRFYFDCKKDLEKRSLLKLCFVIPFSISLILSVLFIILFINGIIKSDYSLFICVLLCICITLTVWERMSNEMMQNSLNSKMYSFASVCKKIVYCIGSVVLLSIYKDKHFPILAITTVLSILTSVVIGTLATRKFWNFSQIPFPDNTKEIFSYSLPMYIYFVVYSLFDSIDKLFVEHFCSDYEIGIYGSAFSLVGVFSVVQFAFMVLWRPLQTEHYTNNPNDMSFIQKGNRYTTILMFFLGINMIMFKDVICLLLGPSYRSGVQYIPFLVFNPIMNTMIWTVTSGIEISRKSHLNILIIFFSLAVLSVGSIVLIPSIGAKGSAISVTMALIAQYYLTLFFSNKNQYVDYGTGRMTFVLVIMVLYAYVNTFYQSGYLNVFSYVLCLCVFFKVYHLDIKDMVSFVLRALNSKKK